MRKPATSSNTQLPRASSWCGACSGRSGCRTWSERGAALRHHSPAPHHADDRFQPLRQERPPIDQSWRLCLSRLVRDVTRSSSTSRRDGVGDYDYNVALVGKSRSSLETCDACQTGCPALVGMPSEVRRPAILRRLHWRDRHRRTRSMISCSSGRGTSIRPSSATRYP